MALVVLPTSPNPVSLTWMPVDFGAVQEGVLGGAAQRVNRLGNRWQASVAMPPMSPADARAWAVALASGVRNGVRWAIYQPGFATGDPGAVLVNGSGQAGTTLACDGATPGYQVSVGQYASVLTGTQRYMYQIAALATASAGGGLTLTFTEPLRVQPANNDFVELAAPQIEGFLADVPAWGFDPNILGGGFSFTVRESR